MSSSCSKNSVALLVLHSSLPEAEDEAAFFAYLRWGGALALVGLIVIFL